MRNFRKILGILSLLFLLSCTPTEINEKQVSTSSFPIFSEAASQKNESSKPVSTVRISTKYGFSFQIPVHASHGANYVAYYSPEDFMKFYKDSSIENYYDFIIKDPQIWYGTNEQLVDTFCPSKKAQIEEEYKVPNSDIILVRTGKFCAESTYFFILKGQKLFQVVAGQDTRSRDGIWEVLKTIQFDS